MTRWIPLCVLLGVSAFTPTARAQATAPLYLTAQGLDADTFASALSGELGRRVVVSERPDSPSLQVVLSSDGLATLAVHDVDGSTRERVVQTGSDRTESERVLLLAASNLVRNPIAELIAPATRDSESEVAPPPVSFAEARPLRLGVSGMLGLHSVGGQVSPYGTYGLSLVGTFHPNLAMGLSQLKLGFGASSVEGFLFEVSSTPAFEVFGFVDRRVQVYGQVGVTLQIRSQTAFREDVLQVAPHLAGGVRLWASDWFSIGLELAVSVVATDAFLVSGVPLPQGTMPGTLGLAAEFHIAP